MGLTLPPLPPPSEPAPDPSFDGFLYQRRRAVSEEFIEDAVSFAKLRLGFELDARQTEVLSGSPHRVLLCCSRQWGKSTVAAIAATHHLLHNPRAFVAVISPAEKQSAELIRRVRSFLQMLHIPCHSDGIHRHSVQLPAGSRIIALTSRQSTNRGISAATLLIVDEAAQVPDAVYDAVRPALATTGGAIWLISTPYGKRGFFWEAWAGNGEWSRYLVTARDCPRLSREFLLEELRTRGERRYQQEYECVFHDDAASLFDVSLLLTAVSPNFQPLFSGPRA